MCGLRARIMEEVTTLRRKMLATGVSRTERWAIIPKGGMEVVSRLALGGPWAGRIKRGRAHGAAGDVPQLAHHIARKVLRGKRRVLCCDGAAKKTRADQAVWQR